MSKCLKDIVMKGKYAEAVEYVKSTMKQLFNGKINTRHLVISKQLSRKPEDYATKMAHVELSKKMKERGQDPVIGDRITYIIVSGCKKDKAYTCGEEPSVVVQNNLPIDYKWYFEHQLKEPISKIFEPIFQDNTESALFKGEHMNSRKIRVGGGIISKYLQVAFSCYGCGNAAPNGRALCQLCDPVQEKDRLEKEIAEIDAKESKNKIICNACVGNVESAIASCINWNCETRHDRVMIDREKKEKKSILDLSW